MPPLRLTSLLHTALPDLSTTGRAVLSTLACRNGLAPSADEVAQWVGLRDRHQLHRWLRREGLPPLKQMEGWARVLYWMAEAEVADLSLLQLARREHVDPAVAYRLVHRVTGQRWTEARRAGLGAALLRFRDRCRVGFPHTGSPPVAAPPPAPRARNGRGTPPRGTLADGMRAEPGGIQHPTGRLAGRVVAEGSPFDVTVGPERLAYVTRTHAATLECVALDPFRSIASIPTGAVPTCVVLSPSGREAYVTIQFAEEVAIIDLADRQHVGSVAVPGHALGVALSPDGRTLFVTTNRDRVCAVSVGTWRVMGSVPIRQASTAITMHPSGRWVYAATWKGGTIVEIDVRNLVAVREFPMGGITQDPVVSADGTMLYAANQAGWLDAWHLPTGRHAARLALGTGAVSLSMSPDGWMLYAGLLFAGRVAIVGTERLQIQGTIETGGKPRRIAFDPTGHSAVVANESGWLDLVQ